MRSEGWLPAGADFEVTFAAVDARIAGALSTWKSSLKRRGAGPTKGPSIGSVGGRVLPLTSGRKVMSDRPPLTFRSALAGRVRAFEGTMYPPSPLSPSPQPAAASAR